MGHVIPDDYARVYWDIFGKTRSAAKAVEAVMALRELPQMHDTFGKIASAIILYTPGSEQVPNRATLLWQLAHETMQQMEWKGKQ